MGPRAPRQSRSRAAHVLYTGLRLMLLLGGSAWGLSELDSKASGRPKVSTLFLKNQCINSVVGLDKTEAVVSLCESINSLTQSERAMAFEFQGLMKEHAQLQWSLRERALDRGKMYVLKRENANLRAKLRSLEDQDHRLVKEISRLSDVKEKELASEKALLLQDSTKRKEALLDKAKGQAAWRALFEARDEVAEAKAIAAAEAAKVEKSQDQLEAANSQNANLFAKLQGVTKSLELLTAKDGADKALLMKQITILQDENRLFLQQFVPRASTSSAHG